MLNKQPKTTTEPKATPVFERRTNWDKAKTIILTALAALVAGVIIGYFGTIDMKYNARADVIQDMQVVSKTVEQK